MKGGEGAETGLGVSAHGKKWGDQPLIMEMGSASPLGLAPMAEGEDRHFIFNRR